MGRFCIHAFFGLLTVFITFTANANAEVCQKPIIGRRFEWSYRFKFTQSNDSMTYKSITIQRVNDEYFLARELWTDRQGHYPNFSFNAWTKYVLVERSTGLIANITKCFKDRECEIAPFERGVPYFDLCGSNFQSPTQMQWKYGIRDIPLVEDSETFSSRNQKNYYIQDSIFAESIGLLNVTVYSVIDRPDFQSVQELISY